MVATFHDPQTPYEWLQDEMEKGGYLQYKERSKKRTMEDFPDTLSTFTIERWRAQAVSYKLYQVGIGIKDTFIMENQLDQVLRWTFEEVVALIEGRKKTGILSDENEFVNLKAFTKRGYDYHHWFVFFARNPKYPGENGKDIVMVLPDDEREDMYGNPVNTFSYPWMLKLIHDEENKVLANFRGKFERPTKDAVRNLRRSVALPQDEFARQAGISKTTLVKAENGGNISIDVLMKLAAAADKVLNVSFD